jgi:hypothetical protein
MKKAILSLMPLLLLSGCFDPDVQPAMPKAALDFAWKCTEQGFTPTFEHYKSAAYAGWYTVVHCYKSEGFEDNGQEEDVKD